MNWHELKDGRSIAIDSKTFYVKAKDASVAEAKQTLLFYPKKTIFFHFDDRKKWMQFDGHYYHFQSQEKKQIFVQELNTLFPDAETVGIRGVTKYPYRPQVAAVIILNLFFWIGISSSRNVAHSIGGRSHRVDPGEFIDLLAVIPHTVLITCYVFFSVAAIIKMYQTSQRIDNETVIRIT